MFKIKITEKQLERLRDACDKDNLSNFKLIENENEGNHYIFRIVCQRLNTPLEVS